MASTIDTSAIVTTYPAPGENNITGFHTNFGAIKTNGLDIAKTEITALQDRATALEGDFVSKTDDNVFNGYPLMEGMLLNKTNEKVREQASTAGAITLAYADGQVHTLTTSDPVTLSMSWVGAQNGSLTRIRLIVTIQALDETITFPAAVTQGLNGIAGVTSARVLTFPAIGVYVFDFDTIDSGTNIRVTEITKKLPVRIVQTTPATITTTITVAQMQNGLVLCNNAGAVSITLPAGTTLETDINMSVSGCFEWSAINIAAGVTTFLGATGHTFDNTGLNGKTTLAAKNTVGSSGRYLTRKTATNLFVTYRIA